MNRRIIRIGALVLVGALSAAGSAGAATKTTKKKITKTTTKVAATAAPSAPTTAAVAATILPAKPTKSEIVIGVPVALSGSSADSGNLSRVNAEAWGKWVNANGGINGHPVKLVIADSGPDAVKGLATLKQMVEGDKVLAVVGEGDPGEAGWLPYLQESKVPTIGGGAGNPPWYKNSYLFALGHSNFIGFLSTPLLAQQVGAKTMFQVVCAEIAGCAEAGRLSEPIALQIGIEYAGTIKVSGSAPSYTAECLAIKQANAGYVHLWVAAAGVARVAAECDKQGVQAIYGGSPGGWNVSTLATLPASVKIEAMTQGFPWWVDDAPVKSYRDIMAKYANGEFRGAYGTYTWSSLELFRKALANVSDNPTRQEVVDSMYKLKDETLDGLLANKINFTNGQNSTEWRCFFLNAYQGGKFSSPKGGLTPTCIPYSLR